MIKNSGLAGLFIGTSSLAMAISAPVMAQDTAGAADDSDIIIVTANKREQNIQDVPLSVTAIGGDALSSAGVSDLGALDKLAPGLQFGQSGNDARPAIRGARTDNVSVQQDPVISFFVDGVYRSRTSQALAAFVDVNRVEVLRGPQGTLYGRNSFGGAVNVISNQPENDLRFGASLTVGNYSRIRAEGFFNAPLSDTLFARISVATDSHDGFVKNTFNRRNDIRDKNETYVRGQLRWEPISEFDATLRASLWKQGGNGGSDFGYFNSGTPINPGGGAFTYAEALTTTLNPINPRVGGGNSPSDAGPYSIARDADFQLDTEQKTLDFEANYDFGAAAVKLLVGYADFQTFRTADADLSIFPSGFEYQDDRAETFTQELQINSVGDGPLQWTVGAFHLNDDTTGIFAFDRIFNTDPLTNRPIETSPAPASDFNSLAEVNTESLAFYGQATFSITDAIRATGGVRWTRDKKDFARLTNSTFTNPVVFTGVPFRDSATFKKVTWRGGLEADLSPDNLLYATVSTGFQSGGFNNSADAFTGGASFNEQTVTAYEIGSKNSFADGALTANLSLFWNEFDGLLANQSVNTGPPSNTVLTISTNAGSARARGAELELKYRPDDNLNLSASFAFNDAEYKNYEIRETISGTAQNLRGTRIALTPGFTANLGVDYGIELAGGAKITPGVNVNYSSEYSTTDVNYAFAEQGAFAKVDLSLTYTGANGNWSLQAYGRNVTDEAIFNRTVIFGQNAIVRNYADPATFGVRLSIKN
ncbi:MAG: TonB-dependent receptor [Parasphingorhabdus sp.]|nr:TonB-dependent receptor [Parasphingorhabdus sp.]